MPQSPGDVRSARSAQMDRFRLQLWRVCGGVVSVQVDESMARVARPVASLFAVAICPRPT